VSEGNCVEKRSVFCTTRDKLEMVEQSLLIDGPHFQQAACIHIHLPYNFINHIQISFYPFNQIHRSLYSFCIMNIFIQLLIIIYQHICVIFDHYLSPLPIIYRSPPYLCQVCTDYAANPECYYLCEAFKAHAAYPEILLSLFKRVHCRVHMCSISRNRVIFVKCTVQAA
jgi:hypothetical protein